MTPYREWEGKLFTIGSGWILSNKKSQLTEHLQAPEVWKLSPVSWCGERCESADYAALATLL